MSSKMTKNICRTCLSSDGELISLFSATSNMACLSKKIMNISHVLIQKQEDLPYMICKKCIFLVESFDCFKKQMESANRHIENAWHRRKGKFLKTAEAPKEMANFSGRDEECDDLDYEIEYISKQVKRDVESAFKRKRENIYKKKLTKVCPTLKEPQDIVFVPIKDIKEKKTKTETVITDHGTDIVTIETDKPYGGGLINLIIKNNVIVPKDIEPFELQKFDQGGKKQAMTKNCHKIDTRTFEIINSFSANKNVTMTTGKLNNIDHEICKPNCDNREKILAPDKFEIIEKEPLPFGEPDCGNHEEISGPEKPQNFEENILVPGKLDCDNKEEIIETENRDESEGKDIEPDFNKAQDMETEKPDGIAETIFQPPETNFNNEATDIEIVTPNDMAEKTFQPQEIDCNNHNESMYTEKPSKTKETILPENSNKSNETMMPPEKANDANASQLENLNYNEEDQFVDGERFDDIEKKALKTEKLFKIEEKISKKFNEKRKIVKGENPNDVIVISSDSSDEERYRAFIKNGMRTGNRRSSWPARSSRIKILQPKLVTRKNEIEEKKMLKVSTNDKNVVQTPMKKRQPGKYFQCTTCNINLYSVTAVLYHHNENHTSSHECLSCQMCDKIFLTKNLLFQHFDQHLEAHLYRCSECNCEFVLKRNLRAHVNCHAREELEEPESKRSKLDDENSKQKDEIIEVNALKEEVVESGIDDCKDSEKENILFGKLDVKKIEMNYDENVGREVGEA